MKTVPGRLFRAACGIVLGAALAVIHPGTVFGQQKFPGKPVTIVVPYPPGGSNDTFAREIGKKLSDAWKLPVIIENKPGAGGNIGATYVSRAAPDGYTICLLSSSFTTNAAIQPNLPFDPVNGFTPVAMIAKGPMLLTVGNHVPAKTTRFPIPNSAARRTRDWRSSPSPYRTNRTPLPVRAATRRKRS